MNTTVLHCLRPIQLALLLLCSLVASTLATEGKQYSMPEVKAAIMGKVCDFVEWPDYAFGKQPDDSLVFAIYGQSGISEALITMFTGKVIKGRAVKFVHVTGTIQADEYHILYVASASAEQLKKIIGEARKRPLLVVSDTDGFGEQGVHINIRLIGTKVRFEINRAAVSDSPLKFSYQLMERAILVGGEEDGE